MHPLFFTKPIKPSSYYLGRFGGALVLNIMVQMTASIGLFIGFLMPYLDQEGIGPFRFDAYLQPFLVFGFPMYSSLAVSFLHLQYSQEECCLLI